MLEDAASPPTASPARLRLLGEVALERPGEPAWRFLPERRFRLLAYLGWRGDWVSRDQLAALFWPERAQEAARSNLRKLLLEARGLGLADLQSDRTAVRWAVATDVAALREAQAAGDHEAAISLYGGDLLRDLDAADAPSFTEWLERERLALRTAWRASVLAVLARRAPAERIALARRLIDADPLDEDAVVVLLQAQHALGEVAAQAGTLRVYATRLIEDLGVEPSARVRAAAAATGRPVGVEGRVPTTAARSPASTDSFFGREPELQALDALLALPENAVVTLAGPGGMGKSRLLKEYVKQRGQESRFSDGVCWIALDECPGSTMLLPRLANELQITLTPQGDPLQRLKGALAHRRMLLAMDNAEGVEGLAVLLDALTGSAPGLRVAVSSRTRIGCAGERVLTLRGLDLDSVNSDLSAAARLFSAHACASSPRFDPHRHVEQIETICRQLGGLPLALQLAAAWVRHVPVHALAQELSESLDLLQGRDDGDERPEHVSMRLTIERSWALLAPSERRVMQALACTAGGFTRAAAHEIAAAPLPLLVSLLEKSLLEHVEDGRFALHPLIHRFLLEQPGAADTVALAERRHAAHYGRLLQAYSDCRPGEAAAHIRSIELDFENHRRAWQQACRAGDAAQLAGTAPGLARFCELRGRWDDGIELLASAHASLQATADGTAVLRACAVVLTELAQLRFRKGELQKSESDARTAFKLAAAGRLSRQLVLNVCTIGRTLTQRGVLEDARRYLADGVRRARREQESSLLSAALVALAVLDKQQGRYAEANQGFIEALDLRQRDGDQAGQINLLINMASMFRAQKRTLDAMPLLERALDLATAGGFGNWRAFALTHLALAHYALKNFELTRTYGEQALSAARSAGEGLLEPSAMAALARSATARGEHREAARHLLVMFRLAHGASIVSLLLAALAIYGEQLARQGDPAGAATLLAFVIAHPKATAGDQEGAHDLFAELAIDAALQERGYAAARGLELEPLVRAAIDDLTCRIA